MKNIRYFYENFQLLEVKFSIYLNRRVFVMESSWQVKKSSSSGCFKTVTLSVAIE